MLGLGHFLRMKVKLFQKLYLPSCVIGGLLGLLIIQFAGASGFSVPESYTAGWSKLPSFLINIVFACLFLGVTIPKISALWKSAGIQLCYGQIVAWGQYVVGIGVVLAAAAIWGSYFGLPEAFGGVLPVGFEGGHGTAAGMGPVFAERGWAAGKDFALASATGGIICAIVVGMMLVNWAVRRGHVVKRTESAELIEDNTICVIPIDKRRSAGKLTISSDAIETFSFHIVIVGIAIFLGVLIKEGLILIQSFVPYLEKHSLLSSFPLFPLCMIGGLIVQKLDDLFDKSKLIDLGLTKRIQNSALDFLVVAAIATIKWKVIVAGIVPLLILIGIGIAWNVFCVLFLARRIFNDAWFERAIAEMGQSMGVTATGLLLLRVVDPDYETPAADAFACKQLLHEPFMGGGLWTSMAIPLIFIWGGLPVFLIALGAVFLWLIAAFFVSRKL